MLPHKVTPKQSQGGDFPFKEGYGMKFFYYLSLSVFMVISIFTTLLAFSLMFGVLATMVLEVFSL